MGRGSSVGLRVSFWCEIDLEHMVLRYALLLILIYTTHNLAFFPFSSSSIRQIKAVFRWQVSNSTLLDHLHLKDPSRKQRCNTLAQSPATTSQMLCS